MSLLQGKKAVVTGAAQGLGAAIVHHLAEEGCDVAGWDLAEDAIDATMAKVAAKWGCRTQSMTVDVCDAQRVCEAMDETAAFLGGLDIAVCNAGILIAADSLEFSAAQWRKVIDVNLVGYFLCAREAARCMLESGGGSIVQINSKSGKKGSFKNSAYAASKFGGIGVTQSLALEYAERGVRINSVCPGNLLNSPLWVNSLFKQYAATQGISEEDVRQKYIDQVPMKRPCEYRDVTNVVVFLASEMSGYMTGQAINVTGGQEMR